jgi:hypothetical protein
MANPVHLKDIAHRKEGGRWTLLEGESKKGGQWVGRENVGKFGALRIFETCAAHVAMVAAPFGHFARGAASVVGPYFQAISVT